MAILIKGMDMPIGCFDCDFCYGMIVGRDDCYHCGCPVEGITGRNITAFVEQELEEMAPFVPDWCPLVEVPKGSRLIDAKDVKKHMIPLNFSVQNWISEVDLDIKVKTIFENKKEQENEVCN